jgi:hypothetical protein
MPLSPRLAHEPDPVVVSAEVQVDAALLGQHAVRDGDAVPCS